MQEGYPKFLRVVQMAKNNGFDPNLWYVFGEGYDLTEFVEKHPGGRHALLLGKGRDCTNLIRSYHYFSPLRVAEKLEPYKANIQNDPLEEYELKQDDDSFYKELKEYTREYIQLNGSRIQSLNLLVGLSSIILTVFFTWHLLKGELWAAFVVPFPAWIATCTFSHDGAHFANFRIPILNRILGWTCMPFYFNSCIWTMQHVYSHHSFTNDEVRDVDLHHSLGVARISPNSNWKSYMPYSVHQFLFFSQMFFSTFAESILYPVLTVLDYTFGTSLIFSKIPNKNNIVEIYKLELIVQMGLSLFVFLSPAFNPDYNLFQKYILGVVPFHISSVIFIFATQFAHLTEVTQSSIEMRGKNSEPVPFSHTQIKASLDVSPENRLLNMLIGGLNTQSLHHLIPKVHNSHLPNIYPEYARLCEKNNISRNTGKSVLQEMQNYFKYIIKINVREPQI